MAKLISHWFGHIDKEMTIEEEVKNQRTWPEYSSDYTVSIW